MRNTHFMYYVRITRYMFLRPTVHSVIYPKPEVANRCQATDNNGFVIVTAGVSAHP